MDFRAGYGVPQTRRTTTRRPTIEGRAASRRNSAGSSEGVDSRSNHRGSRQRMSVRNEMFEMTTTELAGVR